MSGDQPDCDPLVTASNTQGQMTQSDTVTTSTTRSRIVAIIAASSGNLVEWFDFYVYSFCSIYFSSSFFPSDDPISQQMNTAGVFAAGFLMRPVGSCIFGRLADRRGRRFAMLTSILMMCGGSLSIALLPTYATIGAVAPLLLLLARLVQGLSMGGEYGTSATYMSEVAIKTHRGFYAAFGYVTLIGGQFLASLTVLILQNLLTGQQLTQWGWRIPFLVGAIAALIALFLRHNLVETSTAENRSRADAGTFKGVWHNRKAFLTVLGFTAGGSLCFYTFTTYMQKYLVNSAGMAPKTVGQVMTAALLVYMVIQPLFGALSDKIGRRNSMLLFGSLMTLLTIPVMGFLKDVTSPYAAFGALVVMLSVISLYTSISGLIKAEMFPPQVRALGVGLSYAIGNAAFGGSAEYVALWFKSQAMEARFYWYVTALCFVALLVAVWMRDPSKEGFLRDEP